jgi:hypothetical protein
MLRIIREASLGVGMAPSAAAFTEFEKFYARAE